MTPALAINPASRDFLVSFSTNLPGLFYVKGFYTDISETCVQMTQVRNVDISPMR